MTFSPIKPLFIISNHLKNTLKHLGLLCFSFLLYTTATAQGNLLIFPRRLVFEGSQKSQTLNLANTGKDTVKYTISVVQIRMKKDGSFENITQPDSGQNFADKYFRFYPRNVVLGPNESQSVKIQLTNTAQMVPGEYRSHVYFRSEQDKKPLGETPKDTGKAGISVNLIAVFGISIPVIIQVGAPALNVNISNPSFVWEKNNTPALKATLNRSGNISAYGDITVDHIDPTGKITPVSFVKGLAIYTPNTERNIMLELVNTNGINYRQGKLRITYTQADNKAANKAEAEVILQ